MVSSAQPVDMEQFLTLLSELSPDISVCVRGKHAVGKSEGVYQAAARLRHDDYKCPKRCAALVAAFGGAVKTPNGTMTEWKYEYGLPVVERRLSQMTEGDIIGLPFREGKDTFDEKTGKRLTFASTQFKPCDWIIISAEFPVMLFMDERNRALPGVKQAVFQLTDSKAFYGTNLHPDTRIVIAENVGDEYQIESCDPAEVSRCATIHLNPPVKDFLDYIADKVNILMLQFLREHENLVEHSGQFEPNKKYPDRRSWFKLDGELTKLGIYENPTNPMFHVIVGSFVGIEATSKFVSFVREYQRNVTAVKILKDWHAAKKILSIGGPISAESFMECAGKVQDHFNKKLLDDDQVYELARFMFDAPAEVQMSLWTGLQSNMDNLMRVHVYVRNLMVATTGSSQDNVKPVLPPKTKTKKKGAAAKKADEATTEKTATKKKRGAKTKTT